MENTLFLQSEVQNPYEIYMRRLTGSPVYCDTKNNIVAVYSHELCKQILTASYAVVPQPAQENGLNETSRLIKNHLARIARHPAHITARNAATEIFNSMQPVSVTGIMDKLVTTEIDWVKVVGKKLPAIYLLKSFEFDDEACEFILPHIETLTKIMLPQRTGEQNNHINNISPKIYELISTQLLQSRIFRSLHSLLQDKNLLPWYVSNLAGLLIQGYDAGRGLLSNALLQVFCNRKSIVMNNQQWLPDAVTETLRFDPPVQNTRRVLTEDINLQGIPLRKGQNILVVLAAANRDATVFQDPHTWNVSRHNNSAHLTFGAGPHACLAGNWITKLAAEALFYLSNKFSSIEISKDPVQYEPLVNLRLPRAINIRCLL
jgi:cytochrome P450